MNQNPDDFAVTRKDPTFSLFYVRYTSGTNLLRETEAGEIREIEQAPDGGVPPWEDE